MATETRHAGLTADERSTIRSTVLKARETIENDLYRQLERYGVYDDERVDIEALEHLDSYDKQIRSQIDAALDRELKATDGDYERSVENYVREATKTYLNRLVALKTIEVRGLVTETMIKRPMYGNRSEMHRTVGEVAGELTDQPDNGLGVALELAFTELTDEIGVIFQESEHTAIKLDFTVREEIIEQLNKINVCIWESDEAMGWVYQYFGDKEREKIDSRISKENYKVQDTDVATKTQMFTPRYIVEWMVDNSLGRLWLEMRGEDTSIDYKDNCFYLAPLKESLVDRDIKDVRDIKVLDPACGSGHMLFYAFDVLYEMYLEEGNVAEKYIPRDILKHNLYGIDIDPGAAQLAALSLYVKAKNEEPDVKIEQINIVSADAVLVDGEKKNEVLAKARTDLEERVLKQVWQSFEHIREWGSLVRIEERIEEIIEAELEKTRGTGQTQFTEQGLAKQSSVVSYSGEEESWEQIKQRLLEQVSELAEEALEQNNLIEEMSLGDVEKSVRLLDLFIGDYDVVVSNPPYLGSGKMGSGLKNFVKDNYKGSRDLYTAFIERNGEFVVDNGYVSMITMETFMYLYSFRGLRPKLLNDMNFVDVAHLENRDKGYMNVCYTMRKSKQENHVNSRFNRLVNNDNKIDCLNKITESNREGNKCENVYVVDQTSFEQIGRTPFVYWLGQEILETFAKYDALDEVADVNQGIATGNDNRFLRKWWEVPGDDLKNKYVHYQKSGTERLYYDIPQDYLYWENDGAEIREYDGGNGTPNERFYFEEGITVRGFGKYIVARHADNLIFGQKAYFVTSSTESKGLLNGLINSTLVRFIMNGINPGLNIEAGDTKRIPIKTEMESRDKIYNLVDIAKSRQKVLSSLVETSSDYNPQIFNKYKDQMIKMEAMLKSDIEIIHGIIDELVSNEYGISEDAKSQMYQNLPKNLADYPHITNAGTLQTSENEFREEVLTEELPRDEYEKLIDKIDQLKEDDLRQISQELEVSPYTINMIRHEHDLYTRDEKREAVGRLLSYYVGCALGRWELKDMVPSNNEIIAFDSDFEDNVIDYIRRCIELTYSDGELYERETEMEDILNKSIEDWLRNTFFRYHHCKEYRRRGQRIPVYWQLGSEEGTFSCFIYYQKMDADTFAKLRGKYIDNKIDTLQNRLAAIENELEAAEGDRARDLRSEKEEIEANIDDITVFRDRVDALIDEGFKPDFEAGIWENIQKVDEYNLLAVPLDKL